MGQIDQISQQDCFVVIIINKLKHKLGLKVYFVLNNKILAIFFFTFLLNISFYYIGVPSEILLLFILCFYKFNLGF